MKRTYNIFAGQNVERLAALSDGLFGVAMTLLLLDLHVPIRETIHGEGDLWKALGGLAPSLVVYMMSFMTLGIFWVGQQTQLNHLERSDRDLTWIHLAFLFAVTIMPFSTRLLTEFVTYRAALLVYWANIFMLGALLYFAWWRANAAGLVKENVNDEMKSAIRGRIVVAQSLYGLGALIGLVSAPLGVAVIILIQLNYAAAPRLPVLSRL